MTWPSIDSINFDKLVGPTVETGKGHLDQGRQGLQSTKPHIKLEDAHNDALSQQSIQKTREMGICI